MSSSGEVMVDHHRTLFSFVAPFDLLSQTVEQLLNDRPVRKFNYLTPNQVLQQKIALIT